MTSSKKECGNFPKIPKKTSSHNFNHCVLHIRPKGHLEPLNEVDIQLAYFKIYYNLRVKMVEIRSENFKNNFPCKKTTPF